MHTWTWEAAGTSWSGKIPKRWAGCLQNPLKMVIISTWHIGKLRSKVRPPNHAVCLWQKCGVRIQSLWVRCLPLDFSQSLLSWSFWAGEALLLCLIGWFQLLLLPTCYIQSPVYSPVSKSNQNSEPYLEEGRACRTYKYGQYLASLPKGFPSDSAVKNLPTKQEMQVRSLSWGDLLEEGMATHSSILASWIPWAEETGGLQSMGSQRAKHDWSDLACIHQGPKWSLQSLRRRVSRKQSGVKGWEVVHWPSCRGRVCWAEIDTG